MEKKNTPFHQKKSQRWRGLTNVDENGQTETNVTLARQPEHIGSLASSLKLPGLEAVVKRQGFIRKVQKDLDILLPKMNLPHVVVIPGKNNDLLLQVSSATEATMIRAQLPTVTNRLYARVGKVSLRVRVNPPLEKLVPKKKPLYIPKRRIAQLRAVANKSPLPQLREAILRLTGDK